jgi:hypothetical protein
MHTPAGLFRLKRSEARSRGIRRAEERAGQRQMGQALEVLILRGLLKDPQRIFIGSSEDCLWILR